MNLRVTYGCVKALAPWRTPQLYQLGLDLRLISRRKMVTIDTSNTGWGNLCIGRPAFGTWSGPKLCWNINCLDIVVVHLALKAFLPNLRGHHILVRSDNMMLIAYINHRGGLRLRPLNRLVSVLLLWARTLKVMHVLGRLNQGVDVLPQSGVTVGEWKLSPLDDSDDLEHLWASRSRPLRLEGEYSLSNILLDGEGRASPPRQGAQSGTPSQSYGAFMCGPSMGAKHNFGGNSHIYKAPLCP